jgi:eukaryotic-like serine/threonine-protein kinase
MIGRTFSHYRVVGELGAGGMGIVYRAEDTRLHRSVALKFLSQSLLGNPLAIARFRREAQAASALNHPNICTIYDVGEVEGEAFIAMELLEGVTLSHRISGRPLDLADFFNIGIPITDAISAAHQRGIVHRDVKPGNIFVTSFGLVKILDFGLAKLALPSSGSLEPTASLADTQQALTHPGSAAGTIAYMSPEQVRGQELDARTDIFSLGVVLYEMLTGEQPFSCKTAGLTFDAILNRAPSPAGTRNPSVPPALNQVISKTLEKDRNLRYQHAAELVVDLKRLQRDSTTHTPHTSPISDFAGPARPRWLVPVVLLIAAAMLAVVPLVWRWRPSGKPLEASSPAFRERQITAALAENRVLCAAISPDGKFVAYADSSGMHLRNVELGDLHDIALPDPLRAHIYDVRWFQDGERLLVLTETPAEGDVLWAVSILGGEAHKLRTHVFLAEVSPQDSIAIITSDNREIWTMSPTGENPRKLVSGETDSYFDLAWSPTGQRLAYEMQRKDMTGGGSIRTLPAAGGPENTIISDDRILGGPGLLWTENRGLIFFQRETGMFEGDNLWSIAADSATGQPSGTAIKLTNWGGGFNRELTGTRDGRRLAVIKDHGRSNVYFAKLQAGGTSLAVPKPLTMSDTDNDPQTWTLDSQAIIFASARTGWSQIFRQFLSQTAAQLLIDSPDDKAELELSSDGKWILFWAVAFHKDTPLRPDTLRLMRVPASGGPPEQILQHSWDSGQYFFHCAPGPPGTCLLSHWDSTDLVFFEFDPIRGQGDELYRTRFGMPTIPDDARFSALSWVISPDGSRIALADRDLLPRQIRILDLRTRSERAMPLPSTWDLQSLCWAADGRSLFATVQSGASLLVRINLDGTFKELLNGGREKTFESPRSSPDGHYLAFAEGNSESNAWLLESF